MLGITNINMSFTKLGLNSKLVDEIHEMGFKEPTAIQKSCIPLILEGKDIIGQSLTGSGKTAAFGLPILHKTLSSQGIQALILTPTRELAQQVKEHLDKIGKKMHLNIVCVYGGVGIERQINALRRGEIVVATPGRLLDHMQRGTISLNRVKFVVLDEADQMLDMGFEKDIRKILEKTPSERQTVLFSATMPPLAKKIAQNYLKNPEHIKEKTHVDTNLLSHKYYDVNGEKKFSLLVHLLEKHRGSAIVFCRTKKGVERVNRSLKQQKIMSMAIHGDIPQNKRLLAVEMFKKGKVDVLVATDVAARGIDISGITHIYNFDVPKEKEDYTHRVGRTARAGKKGEAITIVSEYDRDDFEKISKKIKIEQEALPEFEQLRMAKREEGRGEREFGRDRGRSKKNFRDKERKNDSENGFSTNKFSKKKKFGNKAKYKNNEKYFSKKKSEKNSKEFSKNKQFGNKLKDKNKSKDFSKDNSSKKSFSKKKPFYKNRKRRR
jgi:ATP-dependent RNA helicase DeaD